MNNQHDMYKYYVVLRLQNKQQQQRTASISAYHRCSINILLYMHTNVTVNFFFFFFTPSQPGRLYQGVREKEGEYQSLIIPMVSVDVEHYETERKKERARGL